MVLRAVLVLVLWADLAWGHGTEDPPASPVEREQQEWGIAGEPAAAARTVTVRMLDTMRFVPERIDVRLGETVRFVVINEGALLHEFVLGTTAANAAHAEQMLIFPSMEHDEAHMAHVLPGQERELLWHFNRPGVFEFACLLAGHYQAGMVGALAVVDE